ncbi:hypothetical protein HDU87_003277 [Geranomyces variabilis]|uniref:Protein kinase domain-containing protein n=1 Tax=Geranomyces variabilis TaxID=109894 RepID=A0AAD5TKW3_9FUNG|nr:hypothetical protein HDU87_003277 [Geranomyces variabilis]
MLAARNPLQSLQPATAAPATGRGKSPKTPSDWWERLQIEKNRGTARRVRLQTYREATNSLPLEKHRDDPYLLEIWLDYLQLQSENNEDHAAIRDLYKWLKSSRIGAGAARFYIAWAEFEKAGGYTSRAMNIIFTGIGVNAHPVEQLRKLREEMAGSSATLKGGPSNPEDNNSSHNRVNFVDQRRKDRLSTSSASSHNVSDSSPVSSRTSTAGSNDGSPENERRSRASKELAPQRPTGRLDPPARVPLPSQEEKDPDVSGQSDMSIESENGLPTVGLSSPHFTRSRTLPEISEEQDKTVLLPQARPASPQVCIPQPKSHAEVAETELEDPRDTLSAMKTPRARSTVLPKRTPTVEQAQRSWSSATPSITIRPGLRRTISQDQPAGANISIPWGSVLPPSSLSSNNMQSLHTPAPGPLYNPPGVYHSTPTITSGNANDWHNASHIHHTHKDKTNISVNGVMYRKLGLIGRGGSSKVYKIMAQDQKLYALKKVKLKGQEDSAIEGYLNEIALLRRLDKNDRIIHLINWELNEEQGHLLMVLEYGEIDLAHILQKEQHSRLSLNFIRMYWEQMLRAVHAIHEENIIHSDLKPANFLLVEGALKLIDFGIAKSIPNDTTNIQRDYQTGTVNYMAPEAIAFVDQGATGSKRQYLKLGRSSDVWSLGCILYQLVYGRPPFAHLSVMKKLHCIVDPNYTISFEPCEDASLLDSLKRCLVRDPRARLTIPQLLNGRFLNPGAPLLAVPTDSQLGSQRLSQPLISEIVKQVLAVRETSASADDIAQEILDQLSRGSHIDLQKFRQNV